MSSREFVREPTKKVLMETPCIDICSIDPATGICRGCNRTVAEIAQWSAMTSAERKRIMAELAARQPALIEE